MSKDMVSYIPKDLQERNRSMINTNIGTTRSLTDIVFELLRDNYKMGDSTPFFQLSTSNVSTTEISIVSFTCPTSMMGVFKFFGQGAKTVDAFNHVTWRLFRNGIPIGDFGAITGQVGTISNPKQVTERIQGGDFIELRAISDALTYEVYGLLEGWYWSL